MMSLKDSLFGDILGAYVQAFNFSSNLEEDEKSNTESDVLTKGVANVKLS